MNARPSRRFGISLALITAVGAMLRLVGITSQPPTFDDLAVTWTAWGYSLHGETWPTMPHHPPLRNLLVFLSTQVLGNSAIGVKGWSLLFGTLLIAVTGLMVRRASRDERAGRIAAILVALDIVQIVYSRQGINDIHAAFFGVLGTWLTVEALRSDDTRPWRWLLPLAGLSFGLSIASKFYALPVLAACVALLLHSAWTRKRGDEALLAASSLLPLPFLTYLLTYAPWFRRGYGIVEWFAYQRGLIDAMATHTVEGAGFKANTKAILWFLRPFYGIAEFAEGVAGPALSIGVGNPLVWLAVLPAVAYSTLVREQRARDALLLVFLAAAYLPLVLASRPIWVMSSVAVIPYAAGVMGSVISALGRRFGMKPVYAYIAIAAVTSLLLLPLATGHSLDAGYLRPVVERVQDYRGRW